MFAVGLARGCANSSQTGAQLRCRVSKAPGRGALCYPALPGVSCGKHTEKLVDAGGFTVELSNRVNVSHTFNFDNDIFSHCVLQPVYDHCPIEINGKTPIDFRGRGFGQRRIYFKGKGTGQKNKVREMYQRNFISERQPFNQGNLASVKNICWIFIPTLQ